MNLFSELLNGAIPDTGMWWGIARGDAETSPRLRHNQSLQCLRQQDFIGDFGKKDAELDGPLVWKETCILCVKPPWKK